MAKKKTLRPVTGAKALARVLGGIKHYNDREDDADRGKNSRKGHKQALNRIKHSKGRWI